MDSALSAIVWYLAFVFSVTLHEAAHAWVAKQGGDPTAYEGGQVTRTLICTRCRRTMMKAAS